MRIRSFTPIYSLLGLLFGGYYALWQNALLDKGFCLKELATLVAAQTVLSTVIDIPSGVLADRIGHKRTTLIGLALYFVSFALPTIVPTRVVLAVAILLIGAATAFISGAMDSWATEVQEESDSRVLARPFILRDQAQRLGMIVGSLSVPFVARHILGLSPWVAFASIAFVLFVIGMFTKGPRKEKAHAPVIEGDELVRLIDVVKKGPLGWLLFGIFCFGLSDGVVATLFWPTLRHHGVQDVALLGIVQAALSVSRLTGLEAWKRTPWIEHPAVPALSALFSSVGFFAFGTCDNLAVLFGIWLCRIMILSAYFSTIQAVLMRVTGSTKLRATALSTASVVAAVGSVSSAAMIGTFSSSVEKSLHLNWTLGGLTMLLGGAALWIGATGLTRTHVAKDLARTKAVAR